jgi:hypothetical protein
MRILFLVKVNFIMLQLLLLLLFNIMNLNLSQYVINADYKYSLVAPLRSATLRVFTKKKKKKNSPKKISKKNSIFFSENQKYFMPKLLRM